MKSDRPTDPGLPQFEFPPPAPLPESLLPSVRSASTEPCDPHDTYSMLRAILGKLDQVIVRLDTVEQIAEAGAGTAANALSVAKATFEGLMAHQKSFEEYREHAMQQWNRDGERREAQIEELRQSVTDIEQRATVGGQ